jgi:uncharacterized protein (AIM24 family)
MDATVEDGLAGLLVVSLEPGEAVLAASGSLVDHTGGVRVERARQGVLRSVANAASQRQVTPLRVAASGGTTATVRFAPEEIGGIGACDLDGADTVAVARGAFLAAPAGVEVGAGSIGNAPTRGMGVLLTELSGSGTAYVSGPGRVEEAVLDGGDTRVVATDHVVAFEDRLGVGVQRASSMEDAPAVARFHGPGSVWLSSRPRDGRE